MNTDDELRDLVSALPRRDYLRIAFDALSAKAARWVTLGMTFGLFAAFIAWPSWMRLAGVATFAAMVFWPAWLRKDKSNG